MKKPILFGKYHLLERINVGGMAEVFKAKAFGVEGFERLLAVKRILPNIAEDQEFIQMFIDEAKIAVQLNHANICQIFDLGKVAESYFIALELVHGRDLRAIFDHCRQRPVDGSVTMPVAQACFVVMKVCEGLDYAHNKRDAQGNELHLVHRDVSPQNVLLSYDGEVKLIDFGIAKAAGKANKTEAGILKGKFGYMSPEQVRGLPLDRRSDIFSVGIVLYELLTGERLFWGETDFSTLEKVRNAEILPPSTYNRKIPDELERIALKALAKDVEDRYQNAIDLHDELQAFLYAAGEFYSRKDLAAWMKRTFATELEAENLKMEAYRQFAPEVRGASEGAPRRSRRPPPPPRAFQVGHAGVGAVPAARSSVRGQGVTATANGNGRGAAAMLAVATEVPFEPELDEIQLDWADELETNVYDGLSGDDVPPGGGANGVGDGGGLLVSEEMVLAERNADRDPAEISLSPDGSPVPAKPRGIEKKPQHRNGSASGQRATGRVPSPAALGGMEAAEPARAPNIERPAVLSLGVDAHRPPSLLGGSASVSAGGQRSRLPLVLGLVLALGGALALAYVFWLRAPRSGALVIRSEPASGIRLLLDGQPIVMDGQGRIDAPSGNHVLFAEREGFKPWQESVTIRAGEVGSQQIRLESLPTGFLVTSDPAGAKVTLDGQELAGVTPLRRDDVAAGPHHLFVQVGERSETRAITVEAGKIQDVRITLPPPAPTAPPGTVAPAPGPHAANAPHHGNSRTDRHATALPPPPPPSNPLSAALAATEQLMKGEHPAASPKPETGGEGTLRLGTKPWTKIFIDGKDTGLTTPQLLPLSAGLHRIKLVNPEFGIEKSFTVEIHAGEAQTKILNNLADESGAQ